MFNNVVPYWNGIVFENMFLVFGIEFLIFWIFDQKSKISKTQNEFHIWIIKCQTTKKCILKWFKFLKFQNDNTFWNFRILSKNLKIQNVLKLWMFEFLPKNLKIQNFKNSLNFEILEFWLKFQNIKFQTSFEFWIIKCYTDQTLI